jgi:hypothetical protein
MYDIIEGEHTTSVYKGTAQIPAAEGLDETGLPAEGYVPTASGQQAPIPPLNQGYSVGTGAPGVGAGNKTVFDAADR